MVSFSINWIIKLRFSLDYQLIDQEKCEPVYETIYEKKCVPRYETVVEVSFSKYWCHLTLFVFQQKCETTYETTYTEKCDTGKDSNAIASKHSTIS